MIPIQLIVAGVIAVASFGAAWQIQGNRYERTIAEQRAAQSAILVEAHANAKRETERLQEVANAAERKHNSRLTDLRRDLARTRGVADGLRNDLSAARSSLPDASCSSVRVHAATLNTVFGECAAEIEGLAGQAQGHAIDTLKLLESWPAIEPLR